MTTLRDYMLQYIDTRIRSPKTRETYTAAINAFRRYLDREPTIADLTNENIAGMVKQRRDMGRSPNTIRGECQKLLTLWRWLSRQRLAEWPDLELPHAMKDVPIAWTREQMDTLWAGAYSYDAEIKGLPGNEVIPTLLNIIWDSAERIGAVHPLRWERIDFETRWITFVASERKGGMREHTARMQPSTIRGLSRLRGLLPEGSGGPFLFCDRSTLYYHYKRVLQQSDLPTDAKSMFHRLRRTHATHLHLAGGDATLSLGHSSDSMTRQYYLDVRQMGKKTAESLLFRPGRRLKTLWRVLRG